ncbi:pilus assembly FimT family protein [Bradyrhizobium sp. HKCCYLS20291]|uniref:pilus assembly FimT family protein n=1 Tax=Bradyrhizobium sp. HKCCYLS20291 TaxID=3420766 RepID=UPI003EBF90FB
MRAREHIEAGFTLLEVVCALAIIALLAGVLLPAMPKQTSQPRLEAYAIELAALLKADRSAAIKRGSEISTHIDTHSRSISSGVNGQAIRIPDDVKLETVLPRTCNDRPAFETISFFGSGLSCGGIIALKRTHSGYEIRVNWLTGRIELVPTADVSGQ